jgi:hypothetical protein
MNYDFQKIVEFDERVTVFCQIISQYENDLVIENSFQTTNDIEYAVVHPR